jgi:hypothetical protein
MFKKIRARYAIRAFGRDKFPQKPRYEITPNDIIQNFTKTTLVSEGTKVSSIGSCFAEEILIWLNQNNFNTVQPGWGMVYNPRNIKLIVKAALEYETFSPSERLWDFGDGDIRTPYIKCQSLQPMFLGSNIEEALKKEEEIFQKFANVLKNIDVLIITLGQTEYWHFEGDKEYPFYAAPWAGIEGGKEKHRFSNLTQSEVCSDLRETIDLLKKHNSNLKILVSVSPVPLVASTQKGLSAYVYAGAAKSSLHSAVMEVVTDSEDVFYMPSYEIVMAEPHKSFKDDGRHVLRTTVDKIMNTFKELYVL